MKHDIEAAAGHILEAADEARRSSSQQITVVTKNMARNLSPDNFKQWMTICHSVAWSVRDPLVQIGSLLTRIANDIIIEPGADRIKQEDLDPYLEQASAFLESSGVSSGFSKTSWADIGQHYRSGYAPERSAVIDGGELTPDPVRVLGKACLELELEYSPRMVNGWERDYVNANSGYSQNLDDSENGWVSHAATSTGIVAVARTALQLLELPDGLRQHITEIAIPTYEEMTGVKYNYAG
jgi:hypothetical protein